MGQELRQASSRGMQMGPQPGTSTQPGQVALHAGWRSQATPLGGLRQPAMTAAPIKRTSARATRLACEAGVPRSESVGERR